MSSETYPFSELRERAEGNTERVGRFDALAGMLRDSGKASVVADYAQVFEGREYDFRETHRGQRVWSQIESAAMSRAVARGDFVLAEYMRGVPDNKTSIQGFELLREMSEIMAQPASVTVIKGDMGSGKTDFSGMLAELIEFGLFQRYGREYEIRIATNVESFVERANSRENDATEAQDYHAEWEHINQFSELTDRLDQQKETGAYEDERLVYIFDEGSNHVTGYGEDVQDAVQMGKMGRLIRKCNGSLIVIGHSHDIAPILLRLANLIIEKLSEQEASEPKKEARILRRHGDDEDARNYEVVGEIKDIPPTKYDFETVESSDFYWDGDEEAEQMLRAYELLDNQEDVGYIFDCDRSYVSKQVNAIS